jgi:purine-nucleoside phosphorylase
VGMSTVPEVIVAVHGGMKVLGISIITDAAVPETLTQTTLEQIVAAANAAEPALTSLVRGVVAEL